MTSQLERPRPELDDAPADTSAAPKVLTNLSHGGHVAADAVADVAPEADATTWAEVKATSTPFGYLFDDLRGVYPAAHLQGDPAAVVASLKALGTAMVEQQGDPAGADSTIPPIYTYWGQFVDHDLTANTDRNNDISITDLPFEPLQPEQVVEDLRNLRDPRLNLDSVYGNGPAFSGQADQVPYDGDRLHLGETADNPNTVPGASPDDDLPRVDRKAQVGDGRNDENLVVAQLHVAFLKFHNAVLEWFENNPDSPVTGDGSFERARQITRWHYQFVTVHDFLTTIADPAVVRDVLDGAVVPRITAANVFMPLEFSVAAFRFGHSMVRGAYDWNVNFGVEANTLPSSPFEFLFLFTGNGGFGGDVTLPENWPAQFERLTGAEAQPGGQPEGTPTRFARKIDTHIAPPLAALFNEANGETSDRIRRILKRLAVRNLLRGYRLSIPTGQAVARSLGIQPLARDQLLNPVAPPPGGFFPAPPSAVDDALVDGGFLEQTPLWFYVLREAEILGEGNRLGPVGSRIVAETIIGQLLADPDSFINQTWNPSQGVTTGAGARVDSIITFLQFAGRHP
jgi:hypothetical protein